MGYRNSSTKYVPVFFPIIMVAEELGPLELLLWKEEHIDAELATLEFRINVGPTLIYFENFSHSYALIWVPTLIKF